jgi:WD40 repeat protein
MAGLRLYFRALILALLVLAPGAAPARAEQPAAHDDLFERPILAIDPGAHTAKIWTQAVDREGRFAVTGSDDRTIRLWSLEDGKLLNSMFVPVGPDNVGAIYAVAISPDGGSIAAGGHTENSGGAHPIYVFDRRSGKLLRRIGADLADVTLFLAFSPDGRFLVATLGGGGGGLRIFDSQADWREIFRDKFPGASFGAAFSADGRLAASSFDGAIRLYAYDSKAEVPNFHRAREALPAPGGKRPRGLAFSPDGALLALGYDDIAGVDLLDAATLETRRALRPQGVSAPTVGADNVAWSRDGKTLFAAGALMDAQDRRLLFAWDGGGGGPERRMSYCGENTAAGLSALPGGRLLVAGMALCVGLIDAKGQHLWTVSSSVLDFRNSFDALRLSRDGRIVDFGFRGSSGPVLRFDVASLRLAAAPPQAGDSLAPKRDGLTIGGWSNDQHPTLDGKALPFTPYDIARSLALAADAKRFFLGSSYALASFDAAGAPQWRRPSRDEIWAVNASADGRLVVTADGGGALRWRRAADGREILALQVIKNGKEPAQWDWVLWTPEGFYASTPGAENVLKWVVNHGPDQAATILPVSAIANLRRPDALPLALQELETARALGLADMARARCDVQAQTGAAKPPGAVLRVLTIGVDSFGLKYAAHDADDVAAALRNQSQARCGPGLYADVRPPQYLHDAAASRAGILQALDDMAATMGAGAPEQDLAVIHFSGHGEIFDGQFYLIPNDFKATSESAMESSAVSAEDFAHRVRKIAGKSRVLLLLDACHSGALSPGGLDPDASVLRAALNMDNVTVLTSSKKTEPSEEGQQWGGHGAFTKAFLDALSGAADPESRGIISLPLLVEAMERSVDRLTAGRQHIGPRMNFYGDIFIVNR